MLHTQQTQSQSEVADIFGGKQLTDSGDNPMNYHWLKLYDIIKKYFCSGEQNSDLTIIVVSTYVHSTTMETDLDKRPLCTSLSHNI